MKVIPVIDLKGGQAVHAVAGHRDRYRPIQSVFDRDADPVRIARDMRQQLDVHDVYVADLDAIVGCGANDDVYSAIGQHLQVWLDAGVRTAEDAKRLIHGEPRFNLPFRLVLGLESLDRPDRLRSIAAHIDVDRLVFSLDLRHGKPIFASEEWQGESPSSIVDFAIDVGIRTIIVLDLATVGMGVGPTVMDICETVQQRHPHARLIPGGGIRDATDLTRLAELGCWGVLVGTSIHNGTITAELVRLLQDKR